MAALPKWTVTNSPEMLLTSGDSHPTTTFRATNRARLDNALLAEGRHTVPFSRTFYCALQSVESRVVFAELFRHYHNLLRRIPLWQYQPPKNASGGDGAGLKKTDPAVKQEEAADGEENDNFEDFGSSEMNPTAGDRNPEYTFRAIGIITQVLPPPMENEEELTSNSPWEFFVIRNVDDDTEAYAAAFSAMQRDDVNPSAFPLLNGRQPSEAEAANSRTSNAAHAGDIAYVSGVGAADSEEQQEEDDRRNNQQRALAEGLRITLYPKGLAEFSGVYPGMAIGVVGKCLRRSSRGQVTEVLVRDLVFPTPPLLPWGINSSLRSASAPDHLAGRPTRVHFCSGPFPRTRLLGIIQSITAASLRRQAEVLIIGGPLVKFADESEKDALENVSGTFDAQLSLVLETIDTVLQNHYATRQAEPRMQVYLVSHRDDVTQVPVMPTTMYSLQDTESIHVLSNPCRISINGVHFGVCNDDGVGDMMRHSRERWPVAGGALSRCVEAFVNSRLYAPIYSFPAAGVDLHHLSALAMSFVPPCENASVDAAAGSATSGTVKKEEEPLDKDENDDIACAENKSRSTASKNWNVAYDNLLAPLLVKPEVTMKQEAEDELEGGGDGSAEPDRKRPKYERALEAEANRRVTALHNAVEFLPHIMLAPSTRPAFAVVTHQAAAPSTTGGIPTNSEGALDDKSSATGVLVVNPCIWSSRNPKLQFRVAEINIDDCGTVALRGAREQTGVNCGLLYVFSDKSADPNNSP